MGYLDLQQRLDQLFEECDFASLTDGFQPDSVAFQTLNCPKYYITLHDLAKLKPVYINDILRDFYGFSKNTFDDVDYFYYFMTIHPTKYGALLDSVLHFKKGGKGFLNLEYKLKNARKKYEKFVGSTRSVFINEKPVFAVTVMEKADFGAENDAERAQNVTPREREIIELYCQGMNVKEVADCLSISESTVKVHLKNIYKKLGVSNSRELITFFEELQI